MSDYYDRIIICKSIRNHKTFHILTVSDEYKYRFYWFESNGRSLYSPNRGLLSQDDYFAIKLLIFGRLSEIISTIKDIYEFEYCNSDYISNSLELINEGIHEITFTMFYYIYFDNK